MSPNCIDADRMADVEAAPEGHPLRQHVAECPRCHSLWLSYQAFMKADTSGATNIETARRELAESIRRRAGSTPAGLPVPGSPRALWPAWLRPALITAMAAVLTLLAISVWRSDRSDEPVLRGGDDSIWVLQEPRVSDDSVMLEWQAVAGADAYEVQFFNDELDEVYRSGPLSATSLIVERAEMPSVAPGTTLTWRVNALRSGDVTSTSPPSSVTVR